MRSTACCLCTAASGFRGTTRFPLSGMDTALCERDTAGSGAARIQAIRSLISAAVPIYPSSALRIAVVTIACSTAELPRATATSDLPAPGRGETRTELTNFPSALIVAP
jgi:hypothetical protein